MTQPTLNRRPGAPHVAAPPTAPPSASLSQAELDRRIGHLFYKLYQIATRLGWRYDPALGQFLDADGRPIGEPPAQPLAPARPTPQRVAAAGE